MRKIIPSIILLGCVIGFISSCTEDDDCSGNARRMLTANILTVISTDSAQWETPYSLDVLNVYAYGTDSIIVNDDQSVNKLHSHYVSM